MPMASADVPRGLNHRLDRLLDAQVEHLVAVVRENNVDEILADVVNVALDGGQNNLALLRPLRLSP